VFTSTDDCLTQASTRVARHLFGGAEGAGGLAGGRVGPSAAAGFQVGSVVADFGELSGEVPSGVVRFDSEAGVMAGSAGCGGDGGEVALRVGDGLVDGPLRPPRGRPGDGEVIAGLVEVIGDGVDGGVGPCSAEGDVGE
jgi:hypothetical protein